MRKTLKSLLACATVLGGAGLGGAGAASGGMFTLDQTFTDPSLTNADLFGSAVAIDGNNVLIGARGDDTNGLNVGQAHLFDTATGSLLQTFEDPTATNFDNFGSSVAIDGTNVLIGAIGDDTNGGNVGQVHLFDALTGSLLQTFDDPTVTGADEFGFSVAIDGNNVLIGAVSDDTNGGNVGQVHLFDALTGNHLQTFDDPTVTTADQFGFSVAIDGNNVLIGSRFDDTNGNNIGQAHLFDALTGSLLQTFNDPTPTHTDQFGWSLAIEGNNALVGAIGDDTNGADVGQAHLFDVLTGNLLQTFDDPTPTGIDQFGAAVAIDGNHVLVGAFGDDSGIGEAHLFDSLTGNLLQTFDDPTITTQDEFGFSVAIDGNSVLIGARLDDTQGSNVGQAHLFSAQTAPVPEPSSLALLGMGVFSLAGFRVSRSRRKSARSRA